MRLCLIVLVMTFGMAGRSPAEEGGPYAAIQKASPTSKQGILQRLAVAVSLELSESIHEPDPDAAADASKAIDPVKRYLHYENAYEAPVNLILPSIA